MTYGKSGLVVILTGTVGLAAAAQGRLPEGAGKTTVESLCATRCHNAAHLLRLKRTPTAWATTMDQMIERGAEMSDSEYDVILEYLSTHLLATVNVNTEPAEYIAQILEISDKEAAAIVECRKKDGPFASWEAVAKVPGVDAAVIEERRARLVFK
jgi:competence ComEA-like helix-hairpin-helix protein